MISLRLSEPDAPDVRAGSDSYTEAAIAAIHGSSSAVHTGGVGAGTAIASRLYELALASAEPIGEGAELLTPAVLARMGRDLAECGETVWLASLEGAMPATWLSHCNEYEVRGGHRLESWMYRLQMTGPSATATLSAPSSEVVHVRLHASRSVPWRGRSPLYVAGQTGALAAMVNQALVEEYSIGSKLIAPMPAKVQGFGQSELNALRQAFSNRKYRFLVFVYRVPAKSPATGLQVRRIPADTWACGRRDSATIRIRSVPSGIRGMPAAFRSWSRRTLNCGRSGIAGSSEANIFRDNLTRRAGRVAGKRPRSPRTDRKDAAGVLDVRPAKPMVGKGAGHVRRRSMKRMQRRFRPRVRTAVGPST